MDMYWSSMATFLPVVMSIRDESHKAARTTRISYPCTQPSKLPTDPPSRFGDM